LKSLVFFPPHGIYLCPYLGVPSGLQVAKAMCTPGHIGAYRRRSEWSQRFPNHPTVIVATGAAVQPATRPRHGGVAMTMLTLGQAARLTCLGKTTLARAVKAGRLSATRTDLGSYQIDPAELHRVYPYPAPTARDGSVPAACGATDAAPGHPVQFATGDATGAVLAAEVAGLREMLCASNSPTLNCV
jgi:hypothetical protein